MTSEVEGLDLDALEKVAREATAQGEWVAVEPGSDKVMALIPKPDINGCVIRRWTALTPRDRDHIATFDPPTVLRLLAALRAQAERVRVLEGAVGEAEVQIPTCTRSSARRDLETQSSQKYAASSATANPPAPSSPPPRPRGSRMGRSSISQVQADILASALSMARYQGARIPYSLPIPVPATWSYPLRGLIQRGYLRERRANMYDVTPEGEAAFLQWCTAALAPTNPQEHDDE